MVDIVQVLTQQPDYQTARKYWIKRKERLRKEGSESVQILTDRICLLPMAGTILPPISARCGRSWV